MDVAVLEQTLLRIPGVEAARIVMNGPQPAEVHVVALPGKPAKQVVRDVQSVAMASFGIQLDRRVVSVVQMEAADLGGGDRPAVEDVAEQIDGSRMTMTVTLSWHDDRLVGTATGPAANSTRLKLVADATLAALEQALVTDVSFAVTAVDTPWVGSHRVAAAVVVIVAGGVERSVVGSALVSTDPSRAMVRAVLDALNRLAPSLRST